MRLSAKFVVFFIPLSIFFVAFVAHFVFSNIVLVLETEIIRRQRDVTQEGLNNIDRFLAERMRDIQSIAESPSLENRSLLPEPSLNKYFEDLSVLSGPWDELLFINNQGVVAAANNAADIGRQVADDVSQKPVFERALEGRVAYSDAVLSDDGQRPTLIFATPVREEGVGRPIIGVLLGEIAWPSIEELLAALPVDHADLWTHDGKLIATTSGDILGKPRVSYVEKDRSEFIHTAATEQGFQDYYGNRWILDAATSKDRAVAPAIATATRLAELLILLFFAYLILVFFNIHVLLIRPISSFKMAVEALAAGFLKERLPVKSRDEFGRLAATFNQMAEKIRALTVGLDAQVKERTKKLQETLDNLNEANEKTAALASRFKAIFDSQMDGVVITSLDRIILDMNAAALAMYGYTLAEVKEKPSTMLHVDQEHYERFGHEVLQAEAAGKGLHVEFEFRRKNGEVFSADFGFSLLMGGDGKPVGRIGIVRDITQRKKNEMRMKELDTLKNKFINIINHQFRTPLSAIRWSLEAMLGGDVGKLTEAQQEFVRIAHDADAEIIKRTNDLLTAIDIEEGRVVISKEEISLESLWSSLIPSWQRGCGLRRLVCEYEAPPEPLPAASADAEKIKLIMEKLADNAITYTPEKGSVKVSIAQVPGAIRFTITDSGIGIPHAEQNRIFGRFFRGTNAASMKPDASGLGLYIAKHFIDQHGGKIGFTSNIGEGTTFWFEIPLA